MTTAETDPLPLPLPLPARLVEMLPGVPRETLASVICGAVAARFDCPSSYLRVLGALISHAGWHSNRVWASGERLAALAGNVRKICVKTVQRAIRFFVRTIGLRILSDTGERLRGPGEHAFVKAGHAKHGDGPVNHYDLSALRCLVPHALRDRDCSQREHGDCSSSPLSPFSPSFPDPFADSAPPATPPLPAVSPVSSPSPKSIETRHASPNACYVRKYKEEAGTARPEKARCEAARPEGFEETKLSALSKKEGGPTGADYGPDSDSGPGFRALAQAGVSAGMRARIIAAMGETWARQAALYTRLQGERGEIRTSAAQYLVAVFQTAAAERAAGQHLAWPDWLQARWEREEAATARIVCAVAAGNVLQSRQQVRPPPALSPALPPLLSTETPDPPVALTDPTDPTDPEHQARRQAARTELRRTLPGAPAALIERLLARR